MSPTIRLSRTLKNGTTVLGEKKFEYIYDRITHVGTYLHSLVLSMGLRGESSALTRHRKGVLVKAQGV